MVTVRQGVEGVSASIQKLEEERDLEIFGGFFGVFV
jgi:hypothetical protein